MYSKKRKRYIVKNSQKYIMKDIEDIQLKTIYGERHIVENIYLRTVKTYSKRNTIKYSLIIYVESKIINIDFF